MRPTPSVLRAAVAVAAAAALGACAQPAGWHGMHGAPWSGGAPYQGGMGPGMGMGPGRQGVGMRGQGSPIWALERLELSDAQRAEIARIQEETWRLHGALMGRMHEQMGAHHRSRGWPDAAADRAEYEAMSALHKQMFESMLEARRRVLEVLTPAQREQLGRWGTGGPGR